MPLERQVISWPLTGGIDTKTAPLMIQPGSHITLDNVRQERTNEWKRRNGTAKSAADTLISNAVALMVGTIGNGGLIAFTTPTPAPVSTSGNAVQAYSAVAPTTRWGLANAARTLLCEPITHSRRTAFGVLITSGPAAESLSCASNGTSTLMASTTGQLVAKNDERVAMNLSGFSTAGNVLRVRTAYNVTSSRYVKVTIDTGGNLIVRRFTDNGVDLFQTTLNTDADTVSPWLDVISYSGSATVTIVYKTTVAGQFKFVEYNATTDSMAVNLAIVQNCVNCLSLLPDPEASGVRFVAVSTATPDVRVLRMTAAGAVSSNDAIEAVLATQIVGSAYTSGAEFMVIYQTATAIRLNTKKAGAVATPASLLTDTRVSLHSNTWRESGADKMSFVIGYHSGVTTDPQDSYFVRTVPFTGTGAGTPAFQVTDFNETQAKILPLDAGPKTTNNACMPQAGRVSAGVFDVPLVRLSKLSISAAVSTADSRYVSDIVRITQLTAANINSVGVGQPKQAGLATLYPSGSLTEAAEGIWIGPHGIATIPPAPGLVAAAGAGSLGLLKTYQYATRIVCRNDAGEEWRSPLSIPATVVLTGGQNQVTVTHNWAYQMEGAPGLLSFGGRLVTLEIYRTKGDGSVFQKLVSFKGSPYLIGTSFPTYLDQLSDTALGSSEVLDYTAIVQTALTPPLSHVETFGQRLWGIHRDYRQQLWFTRKFSIGRSPEFVAAFQASFIDEEGDMTNLAQLDDKLIVFKESAIYFVQGDGPDEAGTGSYPVATRVDSDVGSIVGSPVVSTGQEVYFVSSRGIYMIDRSLQVQFIGAPVDQYLNQPLIQARETVIGAVFSPATNEVRFQTTNYRLVYDRLRGIWYRDTGTGMQNVVSTCMVGSKQALFKTDGTMWIEGDEDTVGDNGVSFVGRIRSAWVRPSGMEGRLRLYMARVVASGQGSGDDDNITLTMRIYYDNVTGSVETFTGNILDTDLAVGISVQPRRHRCRSFALEIDLPMLDIDSVLVHPRLEAWGAEVGLRSGAFRNPAADRWT